jgi:hypothetical protein
MKHLRALAIGKMTYKVLLLFSSHLLKTPSVLSANSALALNFKTKHNQWHEGLETPAHAEVTTASAMWSFLAPFSCLLGDCEMLTSCSKSHKKKKNTRCYERSGHHTGMTNTLDTSHLIGWPHEKRRCVEKYGVSAEKIGRWYRGSLRKRLPNIRTPFCQRNEPIFIAQGYPNTTPSHTIHTSQRCHRPAS